MASDIESLIDETIKQKQRVLAESTCCIYNVPKNLIETNDDHAYRPQVIPIGFVPSSSRYYVMETHKLEFLADLFMRKKNLGFFNELMESIRPLAKKARECYSIGFSDDDDDWFLKRMVIDGCFLIELFLKAAENRSKDPLALIPRAVPYVYGDLLLLENQIPFFVLEQLFTTIKNKPDASETSKMPEESINASLSFLALRFFNKVMRRPDGVIEKFRNSEKATFEQQKPLHLLDLVRSSFIPTHDPEPPKNNEACCLIHSISKLCKRERATSQDKKPLHLLDLVRSICIPTPDPEPPKNNEEACRLIHSISELRRAGIKFKERKAESFLDVKFGKDAIQMLKIIIDYTMTTFLLNCVAFEYLHNSLSKHFTVYASFLDCLVNTALDVGHLCESNIVDSYLGNYDDVAKFINKMGKDLVFDDHQFYLSHVFKDVSDRYQSKCRVQWASFKNRYFNSPWSFISALAALVLLLLTLLQTFYTISAYYVK